MNELKHYGILGMKWGVRRTQEALDRLAGRRARSEEVSDRKDKTHDMSDDDLRKAINRRQMEVQYNQLSKREQSRGERYAYSMLEKAGSIAVSAIAGALVKSGIDYVKAKHTKS